MLILWRFPASLKLLGFVLTFLSLYSCSKHAPLPVENNHYPKPFIHPGHSDSVNSVAFSSDGKLAISGGKDKTVRLWDVESGRQIRVFIGHRDIVTAVAFSPDSQIAISGSYDNTLRLWQTNTGREIGILKGHTSFITSVDFSPDGMFAISGSHDRTCILWDLNQTKKRKVFRGHEDQVNAVAFGPVGKFVVSGSDDKTLRVWETGTGKQHNIFKGHADFISTIAVSPDGQYALSGSWDKTIRLWHLSTGSTIRTFRGHHQFISDLAFTPDGKYFLSGSGDNTLRLWDLDNGRQLRVYKGHASYILCLAMSPKGKYAISGSRNNTIFLWQLATGRKIRELKGITESPKDFIYSVALSPNGKYALSGYENSSIRLWDLTTGKQLKVLRGHNGPVNSLSFSSDSRYFVSGSDDKIAIVWDISTSQPVRIFGDHRHAISAVTLSTNGRHLLTASEDGVIRMWDVATGNYIRSFREHIFPIKSLAISPDSSVILSGSSAIVQKKLKGPPNKFKIGSKVYGIGGGIPKTQYGGEDKLLRLWETHSGIEILPEKKYFKGHLSSINSICFTPDSKQTLSASDDHTFILWDVASGRKIREFKGHSGPVNSLDISSDGELIVSGSDDKTIRIWKFGDSRPIRTLIGHLGSVTSVKFSTDMNFVLSGSRDGTMRLWQVDSDQEFLKFCSFKNGEWIVLAADGYYASSPEGNNLIYWVYPQGIESFSFEQFESFLKRPDVIKERLAGNTDFGKPASRMTRPPHIEMPDSLSIRQVHTPNYTIKFKASATKIVKTIRIFVNGKPTLELPVEAQEKEMAINVPLVAGANRITAVAYDEKGYSSNPKYIDIICINPDIAKPDLYVLGIGVSEYPNLSAQWQLDYAHSDAQALIEAFQNQAGKLFSHVYSSYLANQDATVANITGALENLSAIRSDDVAVIFMAGHGLKSEDETFYFLTSKGTIEHPQRAGLSWSLLGDYLSKIKGRVILMLDACHSGSIVNETVVPNDDLAQEFFTGKRGGIMVFSASKGRQFSMESPDIGGRYGIFTYALTLGLASMAIQVDTNENGFVEFMEVVDYVSNYVDDATGGEQTPWLSRKELFGDLSLAVVE